MADSEDSRTVPAITLRKRNSNGFATEKIPHQIDRRNLLPIAARLLSTRTAEANSQPRAPGPTPVRELWPKWYALYQQHMRACKFRKKLEMEMLEDHACAPIALQIEGSDRPVTVHSYAEIQRLCCQLDAGQIAGVRASLRQRRRAWKKADERLGYSAAVALEQDLAQQAGITGRVMGIAKPFSLMEVAAKLHCLIVTEDPALKLEETPWPELRTMLKDLILIERRR
ncbi:hypothetical protein QO002_004660 [Pararhizobium capsulatum DSM 1112]|uniref:Uncharacterized protein n=1 Tax=Pararhizobium capsulatum DSM 1112 TaxID=1121113 RepID=A0ABU0BW24_9HYPH|nr:hypothetical protein [Pararhizobium capsulatum]MDQ0322454.1 hypothetical protein [Pararhizobium capsulatum DSM 1112]